MTDLPRAGMRQWLGLAVLTLPVLLIAVDNTVLAFSVPTLSQALEPSSAQLLWIVDIYSFVLAGLLVTMGNLGDRIGRRRLLMIGAAGFSVASILAAFAPDAATLIAARALLGVAGATLMPSTLSLLRNIFVHDDQRRFAIATWSTMFAVGSAAGPIIGGWLLEHYWWGAVFLLGVPLTVGLLVVSPFLLPESKDPDPGRWDPLSAVLSFGAMLPFVYGIKMAAEHGVGLTSTLAMAIGLALGTVFVRRQRRVANPMIDVVLFADSRFRAAVTANTVALFAFAGCLFFLTQYLQTVLGLSPSRAGLALVPGTAVSVLCTLSAGRLARRFGAAAVISAGLGTAATGFLMLTQLTPDSGPGLAVGAYMLISAGIGVAIALTVDSIMANVPPAKAGAGSAVSETANELGIALGTALLGSIVLAVYRRTMAGADLAGIDPGALDAAKETLGGAAHAADQLSPAGAQALLDVAGTACTDGMRLAAAAAAAATLGAAIMAARALRPHAVPADAPAH